MIHYQIKRKAEKGVDLDRVVRADIVLVNGLEPTNIIVGMRNYMDIKFSRYNGM